jgi:hypothetical protein
MGAEARMGIIRKAYKMLVWKPEVLGHFGDLGLHHRIKSKLIFKK